MAQGAGAAQHGASLQSGQYHYRTGFSLSSQAFSFQLPALAPAPKPYLVLVLDHVPKSNLYFLSTLNCTYTTWASYHEPVSARIRGFVLFFFFFSSSIRLLKTHTHTTRRAQPRYQFSFSFCFLFFCSRCSSLFLAFALVLTDCGDVIISFLPSSL
ncbi:hypothetical protein B0F90DRAFT_1744753, partial [Multifurca ochricompacta]